MSGKAACPSAGPIIRWWVRGRTMTTDPPLAPAELPAMAILAAMAIMLLSIGWMRVLSMAMRGGDIGAAAAAAGAVERAGTLDKQTQSKKPARAARAEISGP